MSSRDSFPRSGFERDSMPLDAARSAFEWLVAGPHPVSVDGRMFAGLPARRVPLDELRDRLLRRRCPQTLRDAAWAHLVLLARTEGGAWTVGAVGVALPALTSIAAALSARFAGDPSDIHAAVLAGFVAELATIDLRRPRVMLRLRWAAYRAGHACVREALDAPVPSGHGAEGFRSTMPPPRGATPTSCSPAPSPRVPSPPSRPNSSAPPGWKAWPWPTPQPSATSPTKRRRRRANAPSTAWSPTCSMTSRTPPTTRTPVRTRATWRPRWPTR